MSNEEFDNLKEELMWEGSSVVMLSMSFIFYIVFLTLFTLIFADLSLLTEFVKTAWRLISLTFLSNISIGSDEQKLLEASMAYVAGNPIMTDAEFDELKLRLKVHLVFYLFYFRQARTRKWTKLNGLWYIGLVNCKGSNLSSVFLQVHKLFLFLSLFISILGIFISIFIKFEFYFLK